MLTCPQAEGSGHSSLCKALMSQLARDCDPLVKVCDSLAVYRGGIAQSAALGTPRSMHYSTSNPAVYIKKKREL